MPLRAARWRLLLALLLLVPLVIAGAANGLRAQPFEQIRDFTARIEIQPDGAVEVTEEIEVLALGHSIKRGIYRDLTLRATDPLGLLAPAFVLHEALRDGAPEQSRIESTSEGLRIYLGSPDRLLKPGTYRYRLRYRMAEQVAAHDGFDELYWNVNGTGWSFPALRVAAEIVLPPGAAITQSAAYTGYSGEQGVDFSTAKLSGSRIAFATTRALSAHENLTVAVGFPPGFVTHADRLPWLRRLVEADPVRLTMGLLGGLLAYYAVAWFAVGRDPRAGTIVPVYRPDLPPAAMRFIRSMRFDDDCVAAALINLAVKGHVVFDDDAKGTLTLRRVVPPDDAPEPSAGEAVLLNALLGRRGSVVLEQKNRSTLSSARQALQAHFEKTFNRVHFRRNGAWFVGGLVLTALGWVAVALGDPARLFGVLFAVWFILLASPLLMVARTVRRHWRSWRAMGRGVDLAASAGMLAVFCVVGVMLAMPLLALSEEIGWEVPLAMAALGGVNLLFLHLLKAPTAIGRAALDEIEGTRRYLAVAEADRLRFHHPPDRTPQHFEALLPYAVALGLETDWTRQFAAVLSQASQGDGSGGYSPHWYHGSQFSGARLAGLGTALSTSYASASTAPSSSSGSSGSGGGGSSGGGGGGGGGGGW